MFIDILLRLDIRYIHTKLNFPSNLYSIQEIEAIEKNCYFKIITIFNNLIYFFYKENISVTEKKTSAQFYKFFIYMIESIKKTYAYNNYCGEQQAILIDVQQNELNTHGINLISSSITDKFKNEKKNKVLKNINDTNFLRLVINHQCKIDGTDDIYHDQPVKLGSLSDISDIKIIEFKLNFNNCEIDNKEFNIRFDFYDIIKSQLTSIIAERYDLAGLIFKDLLINDNLYVRFENDSTYYISKGYRFYKNIYGKEIKDHIIILKEDYSHKQEYQNEDFLTWQIVHNAHNKPDSRLISKYLVKITYKDKEYNSRYSWDNFPNYIIYNTGLGIRTKTGILNYPMFLPYLKFIIKYDWNSNNIKRYEFNNLSEGQKIELKQKLNGKQNYRKIFSIIDGNNNISNKLNDFIIKTKDIDIGVKGIIQKYLNGIIIEEWIGINKINGEQIKITNKEIIREGNVRERLSRENNYIIVLEENSINYEYISIESILYGSPSLLKIVVEKLLEFNEFDTIDIWKKSYLSEYMIKLNTYNINFLIDDQTNIYIDNFNNLVLKDGDSNHEINKWVAYSHNMFITKNLTTKQYYLNIFDLSIGYNSITLNRNLFYPQIGTCNKKILAVIKNSYINYN